ncbi:MAG TPA: LamG-like jellyroll fold domain-containing protein, partial [Planctomycetota bacterium]|nr:LamG-like jellyroll fold domain-containing protein [Planctomycetota bacterium]
MARWTFDVDWADGGPQSLPTRAEGRLETLDSPIGKGGRLAVFNGVDAWLEVDPPRQLGAGAGDFSLSAWIFVLDRRAATLLGRPSWSIDLEEGGALRFSSDLGTVTSPPGACPPGQWNHLLVAVRRANSSRIFVNGELVATGEVRPGDLDPVKSPLW